MRKLALILVVLALGYFGLERTRQSAPPGSPASEANYRGEAPAASSGPYSSGASSASAAPRANSQFEASGIVEKVLPDDLKGSKHQRFIVRLATGRTVLIAHNIDLAPRVPDLRTGDSISFSGEFEENDKGGVVHWTHHDPAGRHVAGWIRYQGQTYQ